MSLELPFGVRPLNPVPVDAWYYNTSNAPYTNTAQVLSQVVSAIRYKGMRFNVNGINYRFKNGIADGDLVIDEGGFPGGIIVLDQTLWFQGGEDYNFRASAFDIHLSAQNNINASALNENNISGDAVNITAQAGGVFITSSDTLNFYGALMEVTVVSGITIESTASDQDILFETGRDFSIDAPAGRILMVSNGVAEYKHENEPYVSTLLLYDAGAQLNWTDGDLDGVFVIGADSFLVAPNFQLNTGTFPSGAQAIINMNENLQFFVTGGTGNDAIEMYPDLSLQRGFVVRYDSPSSLLAAPFTCLTALHQISAIDTEYDIDGGVEITLQMMGPGGVKNLQLSHVFTDIDEYHTKFSIRQRTDSFAYVEWFNIDESKSLQAEFKGPVKLPSYASVDLPDATLHEACLVYDSTVGGPLYSNGSTWIGI